MGFSISKGPPQFPQLYFSKAPAALIINENQESPRMILMLLRHAVETVRRHFSDENLARLIFQAMLHLGMSWFMMSTEDTFIAVPMDTVISFLTLALQHGYDAAVQQFHDEHTIQVEPFAAAPWDDNLRELMVDLQGTDWSEIDETAGPDVMDAPFDGLLFQDLPMGALILHPQYSHLPTTTILRHVVNQVSATYSRDILAREIWQLVVGNFTTLAVENLHLVSLPFIERALEIGFDAAEAEEMDLEQVFEDPFAVFWMDD